MYINIVNKGIVLLAQSLEYRDNDYSVFINGKAWLQCGSPNIASELYNKIMIEINNGNTNLISVWDGGSSRCYSGYWRFESEQE